MRTYTKQSGKTTKSSKTTEPDVKPKRQAPARTLEGRENQLIAMANDLAEKQLRDGTASSQTIHHFLAQGSTKIRIEKEKLEREVELLTAKTEAIKSEKTAEELYANALSAMQMYSGNGREDYES